MKIRKSFTSMISIVAVIAFAFTSVPVFATAVNMTQDPTDSWFVTEDALPHGQKMVMESERGIPSTAKISGDQDPTASWFVTEDSLPKMMMHSKGKISPKRYSVTEETNTKVISDILGWYETEDSLPKIR